MWVTPEFTSSVQTFPCIQAVHPAVCSVAPLGWVMSVTHSWDLKYTAERSTESAPAAGLISANGRLLSSNCSGQKQSPPRLLFILSCPAVPSVSTPYGYPLETILRIQPLSRLHHRHEWSSSFLPQPCPAAQFSLSVLARPCHASVDSHCLRISEPRAPAVEARSLNHCVAREGPETESRQQSPGSPVSRHPGHLSDLISHSSLVTSFSCVISFTLLFLKHTVPAPQWTFVLLGTVSSCCHGNTRNVRISTECHFCSELFPSSPVKQHLSSHLLARVHSFPVLFPAGFFSTPPSENVPLLCSLLRNVLAPYGGLLPNICSINDHI